MTRPTRPQDNPTDVLTLAQAAKALGVTQDMLRARLAAPEHRARLLTVTHRTRSGVRARSIGLPADLVRELRIAPAPPPPASPIETAPVHAENGALPAAVYRRLLDEKDARINDMRLENQRLHAALQIAQENLARQQRLMTPPPPPPAAHSHPPATGWRRLWQWLMDERD